MRRALFAALPFLALALAGCPAKPKTGECKSPADCAAQEGYGKICVEGRCQECGADADCKDGYVCRQNRCVPKPQCESDAQCPSGQRCQDQRCVAVEKPAAEPVCRADADCAQGQHCEDGKCLAGAPAAGAAARLDCSKLEPIHFGYDDATLSDEARNALANAGKCIQQKSAKRVTIAGHCDERGTVDYNLQLGQRRAEAVRKYLANLGVSTKSLKAVSFGKEKPVCTESNDACWARNRRAELSVE